MEIKINIPEYDPKHGFKYKWELGFDIEIRCKNGCVELIANKEGLISLATQFLSLAQDNIPSGYHLHLDEYGSLNEGSSELIIQKK